MNFYNFLNSSQDFLLIIYCFFFKFSIGSESFMNILYQPKNKFY